MLLKNTKNKKIFVVNPKESSEKRISFKKSIKSLVIFWRILTSYVFCIKDGQPDWSQVHKKRNCYNKLEYIHLKIYRVFVTLTFCQFYSWYVHAVSLLFFNEKVFSFLFRRAVWSWNKQFWFTWWLTLNISFRKFCRLPSTTWIRFRFLQSALKTSKWEILLHFENLQPPSALPLPLDADPQGITHAT